MATCMPERVRHIDPIRTASSLQEATSSSLNSKRKADEFVNDAMADADARAKKQRSTLNQARQVEVVDLT